MSSDLVSDGQSTALTQLDTSELRALAHNAELRTFPSPGDVSVAYRVRLARRIVRADIALAVLAAGAGIASGLVRGHGVLPLVPVAIAVMAVWLFAMIRRRPISLFATGGEEFRRAWSTVRCVFGSLLVVAVFFPTLVPRPLVVVSAPIAVAGVLLSRGLARRALRRTDNAELGLPTLVVGGHAAARATVRAFMQDPHAGARVVGVCLPVVEAELVESMDVQGERIPVVGTVEDIVAAARATGAAVVACTSTEALGPDGVRELLWQLADHGIDFVVTGGVAEVSRARSSMHSIGDMPMMHIAAPKPSRSFGPAKRALDLVVSVAGLIAAAPVMLAIAIAIRIDSSGPVFYRAERVGARGTTFEMLKFRSMYVDADRNRSELDAENVGAGPLFKIKNDPRVTTVGRFIRRYSLDELPQFLNVLRGEMSVVGPRPALAHEVEQYPPTMRRRMLVKPGVTGAWQVGGRSDLAWDDSIRLDVGYVENWSLGTDVRIIGKTVRTVLTSDGAY